MTINNKFILTGLVASSVMLHTGMNTSFAEQDANTEYRVITANSVNFRTGPSTNYSSIGKLNKGDKVEYISESGSWVKVKFEGKTGYVYGTYVGTYTSTSTSIKYVTASSLNVRSGASTNYSVIGTLSKGAKVEVISTSNGWSKIKYNGSIGYVSSKYLDEKVSGDNTSTSTSVKYVTASSLNVRSGASTNYSVIGTLSKGTKVEVISTSNGWSKIKYNGTIGYVSSQYLSDSVVEDNTTTSPSVTVDKVISLAKSLLGKPYVWAAEGPNSFDCSGYTYYVFKKAANTTIPRTSVAQSKYGTYVSKSNLKPGDLVFFDTSGVNDGNVSHVGIYIGNNEFIHCSSSKGKVIISQLNSSYYSKAYVNARRVL
ncbi:C40 family peptidase [Terrisporobacter sp.]|uniref:C40 family peptidase n=1 Tax=Terrisporobacter sp. TaxID=1965305 RepID=UPI002625238A|nr:C40 family peptidase [Terrisporobacter sp.]